MNPRDVATIRTAWRARTQRWRAQWAASLLACAHVFAGTVSAAEAPDEVVAASLQVLPFTGLSRLPGALAVAGDGRLAAHANAQGQVFVWETTTHRVVHQPALANALSVALNSDGSLLAVGQADGGLTLVPLAARAPLRELGGHSGRILSLAFSPDDERLASGSDDGTAQVFEVGTGRRLQVFDALYADNFRSNTPGWPIALAFANSGRQLAVHEWTPRSYDTSRVHSLWDVETGQELSAHFLDAARCCDAMAGEAVGAGGRLLAYAGFQALVLQALDRCSPPRKFPEGAEADVVAVDPQGRWVVASRREELRVFVRAGGGTPERLMLPAPPLALLPLPDGRAVLALLDRQPGEAAGLEQLVRIKVPVVLSQAPAWMASADGKPCPIGEAERRQQDFALPDAPKALRVDARLAPADTQAAAASWISELRFDGRGQLHAFFSAAGVVAWRLQDGRMTRERWSTMRDPYAAWAGADWLAFDRFGHLIWASSGQPLKASASAVRRSQWDVDPDTGRLYVVQGGTVQVFDAAGLRLPDLPGKGKVAGIAARSGRLVVWRREGRIELLSGQLKRTQVLTWPQPLQDEEVIETLELSANGAYLHAWRDELASDAPADALVLRLSDGQLLASGGLAAPFPAASSRVVKLDDRPHRLAVLDLALNAVVARLPRHRSRDAEGHAVTLKAAISDDGRRVASGSLDGLVRVWDIDAHTLLGEARVGAAVTALAFDAPGRQLAVGRAGGQVWVLAVP